jgi:hypothetical protein
MTKVRVVGLPPSDPDLLALLAGAECEILPDDDAGGEAVAEEASESEEVVSLELDDGEATANDNEDCPVDADALLVILTSECPSDDDLKVVVMTAVGRSCRVVGVWPRNSKEGDVPEALERLGDDIIAWDPVLLRRAVGGQEPQWQTPAGERRAQPKTARNSC